MGVPEAEKREERGKRKRRRQPPRPFCTRRAYQDPSLRLQARAAAIVSEERREGSRGHLARGAPRHNWKEQSAEVRQEQGEQPPRRPD